jgi:hypothetical protein
MRCEGAVREDRGEARPACLDRLGMRGSSLLPVLIAVIPAEAGIQVVPHRVRPLDPRLRGDDGGWGGDDGRRKGSLVLSLSKDGAAAPGSVTP